MLIQTGKPDEAEVATDQAYTIAGKADQTIDMQNTQTLAKHTRDTVEILVSPMLIQTGKPDEAEVATDQAYTITG